MALAALVVALVAAVTCIAALAWQVITWQRSGWKLQVSTWVSASVPGSSSVAGFR
jgi:hypothetical protein